VAQYPDGATLFGLPVLHADLQEIRDQQEVALAQAIPEISVFWTVF